MWQSYIEWLFIDYCETTIDLALCLFHIVSYKFLENKHSNLLCRFQFRVVCLFTVCVWNILVKYTLFKTSFGTTFPLVCSYIDVLPQISKEDRMDCETWYSRLSNYAYWTWVRIGWWNFEFRWTETTSFEMNIL